MHSRHSRSSAVQHQALWHHSLNRCPRQLLLPHGAKRKFNTLNHIWKDKGLGRMLRLSIYLRGVISKLVYGNEVWRLRKTEVGALNGWNSRCVSRIT